jgi:hypothetical protein
MATVRFPPPELLELPLEPEVFLGGAPQPSDPNRRASVGRPQVRRIDTTEVSDDPELVAFVAQKASTFYLVRLTCGFAAGQQDRIDSATVRVELESDGDEAIAWSLSPLKLAHKVPAAKIDAGVGITFGPMLSIHGNWAAPEVEHEKCFVYAVGELEPDPEWRYERTESENLNGSHIMAMVIEVAPGTNAHGTVAIEARLTHRNALIRTKVTLPPDRATFTLTTQ